MPTAGEAEMIHKAITLVVAMLGAVVVAQAQPAPHVHRIGILAHDVPPPGLLETKVFQSC
jgi:hypothetical protein